VEISLSEIESYKVKFAVVGGGYGCTIEVGITEISLNDKLKCRGGEMKHGGELK
jgi:hypothetical protein